jgi:hypothetical protein
MIKPTVGRQVWYRPYTPAGLLSAPGADVGDRAIPHLIGQPLAATVTAVWADDCVSVTVLDIQGGSHGRSSVTLWQGEGEAPTDRGYCEWMPYQKGQAAKTEALEQQIGHGG